MESQLTFGPELDDAGGLPEAADGVVFVDGDARLVLRVGPQPAHAHRRQVRVLRALGLALLPALPPTPLRRLVLKWKMKMGVAFRANIEILILVG